MLPPAVSPGIQIGIHPELSERLSQGVKA